MKHFRGILSWLAGAVLLAGGGAASAYETPAPSVVMNSITTNVAGIASGTIFGGGGAAPTGFSSRAYFQAGARGMSAGGGAARMGAWVRGGYTSYDEDQQAIDSDGDIRVLLGGIDYRISDTVLIGVAGGVENWDITTTFNAGSIDADGYMIAPYASFSLMDGKLALDVTGGMASLDLDIDRIAGGTLVKGTTDADRRFFTVRLSGHMDRGRWNIDPSVGLLVVEQDTDAYVESGGVAVPSNTTNLGRLTAGASFGYEMDGFEPYLRASVEYDYDNDTPRIPVSVVNTGISQVTEEDTGVVLGGGLRFRFSDDVSGGIEYTQVLGRDELSQHNVTGSLRVEF